MERESTPHHVRLQDLTPFVGRGANSSNDPISFPHGTECRGQPVGLQDLTPFLRYSG